MSERRRDADPIASFEPELERDGAQLFPAAFEPRPLAALEAALARLPPDRAGARLDRHFNLAPLIGPADAIARTALGPGVRAVRALVLDKSKARNWALGWHQDRVIAVHERRPAPGYGGWTVKAGLVHVEPPFAILERMLTLRIHLDDTGPDNAPLLVAPGSHLLGRIAEDRIADSVTRLGAAACSARAGDVWLYKAPILHASGRARCPGRRRVLQLSYSAEPLGHGLEWLGV